MAEIRRLENRHDVIFYAEGVFPPHLFSAATLSWESVET